jgi:hypothetical protein
VRLSESDWAPQGRLSLLRHRPMQLKDAPECGRIIEAHPVLGPRYGDTIRDLAGVWRRLIGVQWFFSTAVFEESDGASTKVHGVGISVFVTNDFFREAKTYPYFWLGPELTRRIAQGRSPLLTEKQVSDAHSRDGLNLIIWQNGLRPGALTRADLGELCVKAFLEDHAGFRLNEVIEQAETPEQYLGMLNAGAFLYDPAKRAYGGAYHLDPVQVLTEPHLVGLDRETASRQIGSWLGTLFIYQPPLLGLNRSEQRLLCAALDGRTDESLSDALGISTFLSEKILASHLRSSGRSPARTASYSAIRQPFGARSREGEKAVPACLYPHASGRVAPCLAKTSETRNRAVPSCAVIQI